MGSQKNLTATQTQEVLVGACLIYSARLLCKEFEYFLSQETPVTNVTNLQTPQIIQSENSFDSSMETSCLGSIQPLSAVRTRTRPRMALNLCSPNQGHSTPR